MRLQGDLNSPPSTDIPNIHLHIKQFLLKSWCPIEELLYNKQGRDHMEKGRRDPTGQLQ